MLLKRPGPGGHEGRRTLIGSAVHLSSSAEHTPPALPRLVPGFPARDRRMDPPVVPGGPPAARRGRGEGRPPGTDLGAGRVLPGADAAHRADASGLLTSSPADGAARLSALCG